jgi:hypothetical protein
VFICSHFYKCNSIPRFLSIPVNKPVHGQIEDRLEAAHEHPIPVDEDDIGLAEDASEEWPGPEDTQ